MLVLSSLYSFAQNQTRQIILVLADNTHTIHGQLWLLDQNKQHKWTVTLHTPVVLGKAGLSAHRHEGDDKSPMGVFAITTAFGFAKSLNPKLHYRHIVADTQCIDDARSHYYNQIINVRNVKKDWRSSEKMHKVSLYRYGLVISFNPSKRPDAGSCIFMHIWHNRNTGTAGCTAMPLAALKKLIKNLDSTKNPVLIQGLSTQVKINN